jgi:hypothetical protein
LKARKIDMEKKSKKMDFFQLKRQSSARQAASVVRTGYVVLYDKCQRIDDAVCYEIDKSEFTS